MRPCFSRWFAFLAALTLFAAAGAQETAPQSRGRGILRQLSASLVDVHYHLRYNDRGEAPQAIGVYCAGCRTFHDSDLGALLAERRDLVLNGFLVAPDTVLAPDVMLAPDGYDAIKVRFGKAETEAKLEAYYPEYGAVRLRLAKPLAGTKALQFDGDRTKKLYTFQRIMEDGKWMTQTAPFSADSSIYMPEIDRASAAAPGNTLLIDGDCKPTALLMNNNELTENMSLFESWTKWPEVKAEVWNERLAKLETHLKKSVFPVTLYLRDIRLSRRDKIQGKNADGNEIDTVGMLLPDGRFFLPILLTPAITARVERVTIRTPKGDRKAELVGFLKNFGGVVLKPESSFTPPAVAPGCASFAEYLGQTIWGGSLRVFGRRVSVAVFSDVLFGADRGYANREFALSMKRGTRQANILFAPDGRLLALEAGVRAFNYKRRFALLGAEELMKLLADPREFIPFAAMTNRPDDVGFLGIEYQNLTPELAQSEDIAEITGNGKAGLLISYVYPGSPAAKLGLKPGDVLFKLFALNGGAPIVFTGSEFKAPENIVFPWDKLDNIPERFYDEIPEPWPGIRDPVNRLLTNIGIGNPAELLVIRRGKLLRMPFKVAAAPDYFEVAPEYRSSMLGITVSDITFEVRRYFRMAAADPGVVIFRVTPGSPGATAGLRPYEIITAVNDSPVADVAAFEKLVAGKSEVRLTVRRLASARVVTVKLPTGPRR